LYLLDTKVISELRRRRPHGAVLAWLTEVRDTDIYIAGITFGELQAGIEVTREQDPDKANEMEAWIEKVANTYNVLPMDIRTFRRWAQLMHRRPKHLAEDAMIAATADVHNLIVVTCNVRDFAPFKVKILNPFSHRRSA
jgi:predicted nucleic acid-binding protein